MKNVNSPRVVMGVSAAALLLSIPYFAFSRTVNSTSISAGNLAQGKSSALASVNSESANFVPSDLFSPSGICSHLFGKGQIQWCGLENVEESFELNVGLGLTKGLSRGLLRSSRFLALDAHTSNADARSVAYYYGNIDDKSKELNSQLRGKLNYYIPDGMAASTNNIYINKNQKPPIGSFSKDPLVDVNDSFEGEFYEMPEGR